MEKAGKGKREEGEKRKEGKKRNGRDRSKNIGD